MNMCDAKMRRRLVPAVALVVASLATASYAGITTGLQGYWKLDETSNAPGTPVINSGSVAENGTMSTVAGVGVPGVIGTSYLMDDGKTTSTDAAVNAKANLTPGVSTIVDNMMIRLTGTVPTAATTDTVGVNRASLSLWIRPTNNKAPSTGAASRSQFFSTNSDFQFSLTAFGTSTTQSDLFFNYRNAAGANVGVTTTGNNAAMHITVGPDAPWQHVAVTRDAGTVTFFIDGVQVSQATGLSADPFYTRMYENGSGNVSDYNMQLGTTSGTSIRDYSGGMDDAGIWVDHVVTPLEISAIAGLGQFSRAGLDDAGIEAALAVYNNQSGTATVGGIQYSYATFDTQDHLLGSHYLFGENRNILLGGTFGAYTGLVGTVVVGPQIKEWAGPGSGTWSTASLWSPAGAPTATDNIKFGNLATGDATITIDSGGVVNATEVNTTHRYTVALSGPAVFNAGDLNVAAGTLAMASGGGNTLRAKSLVIAASGATLDLGDNSMIVDYAATSPLTAVRQALLAGQLVGAASPEKRLGYAEASDVLGVSGGTFAGQSTSSVAIRIWMASSASLISSRWLSTTTSPIGAGSTATATTTAR
jgi:hypothetical protein